MRLYSLAAAALLSALAAHADTMINQTLTANTNVANTNIHTSSFDFFDPSLGVLDSVSLTLSGKATFVGQFAGDPDELRSVSGLFPGSGAATAGGAGEINSFRIPASGTDAQSYDLGSFEGTGQRQLDLEFINNTTTSGVSGTITYNYTPESPAAVTPEPSSLALLGTGLLGAVGVVRKRLA